jgi:hypothetical protein
VSGSEVLLYNQGTSFPLSKLVFGVNINHETNELKTVYSENSKLTKYDFGVANYNSANRTSSSLNSLFDDVSRSTYKHSPTTDSYNFADSTDLIIDQSKIIRINSNGVKSVYKEGIYTNVTCVNWN